MSSPTLDVFHFGSPLTQKLGCLQHPEDGAAPRRTAVVLCPPLGHEAIRAHRAYRRLGSELAALGFSVLRFDLSGTGDSAGAEDLWGLEAWTRDLIDAVDEVRRRAGTASSVCLVGGRLGAALATRAAGRRSCVAALVLWDPVLSGRAYLSTLEEEHRRVLATAHLTQRDEVPLPADGREILGFALPESLRRDLESLDLSAPSPAGSCQVLTVRTAAPPDDDAPWGWMEDVARAVLPVRAICEITTWIGETCP